MKRVDVVCPAYREEEAIAGFHARLGAVLSAVPGQYEFRIVYVVDPSGDGTEAVLAQLARSDPRVVVLVMSRRFGHQAALIAGIDQSTGDAVLMLDSDLQHPPELIPEMLRQWERGADIVQAIRNDGKETKLFKRSTSRWFYRWFLSTSAIDLRVGAADFRLLSREVATVFRDQIRERNPFIRGLTSWIGFTVAYVPFVPAKREHGVSKYRLSNLLNFAANGILSFSKMPLRVGIAAGVLFSIVSLGLAVLQLVLYFVSDQEVPGWASLFFAVSFMGGIQLLFLGIIGEYIGLIFDEVKQRPRYILARRHGAQAQGTAAELPIPQQQEVGPQ